MGIEDTGEAIRSVLETYAGPIVLIAVGYAYVWYHKRRYLANEEKRAA